MNKESFTDKLLKRFYGITGPLDEYRRQQIDRVGNICYVWLTTILIFGNLIDYILGQKHPEIVATVYPLPSPLSDCFFISSSPPTKVLMWFKQLMWRN